MNDNNKYSAPSGPPPNYPQQPSQAHYDAGPIGPYYQQPGPYDQRGPYPQDQNYGGYYGQPQPGYYGPPQQGMYYQQGPPPPQGYYADNRGAGMGAGSGICAGLLGALACCCCLDFLF